MRSLCGCRDATVLGTRSGRSDEAVGPALSKGVKNWRLEAMGTGPALTKDKSKEEDEGKMTGNGLLMAPEVWRQRTKAQQQIN